MQTEEVDANDIRLRARGIGTPVVRGAADVYRRDPQEARPPALASRVSPWLRNQSAGPAGFAEDRSPGW